MSAVTAAKRPVRTCVALIEHAIAAHRGSMSTLTTRAIASRRSSSRIAGSTPNQPPSTVTVPKRPPAAATSAPASQRFEAIWFGLSAWPRSGS